MLLPPINFIFKLLQQHSIVQIWLYEQVCTILIILEAVTIQPLPRHSGIMLIDSLSHSSASA